MTRAITITSGKGGVGKTNISLNLAMHLASLGHKTCLFDADLGLANINILLGIRPSYDIQDLVNNNQPLEDVLFSAQGIDILPGSSGVEELANLDSEKLAALLKSLTPLSDYDFLIFDTSAGIARNVIAFCLSCPEVLIVITPEPTSLTDAYALLKVLAANNYKGSIKVVINQCADIKTAKQVYKRFKDAVDQYMGLTLEPLGVVYKDTKVTEAVGRQVPFLTLFPDSVSAKCIKKIAERLLENQPEKFDQEILSFWEKCLHFMSSPLELTGAKNKPPATIVSAEKKKTDTIADTAVEKTASSKVPYNSIEATVSPQLEQSFTMLAKSIADGIASISSELKEIRKELLNGHKNGPQKASAPEENNILSKVKPIHLDIDSYLRNSADREKE